jgi:metacaspase-1
MRISMKIAFVTGINNYPGSDNDLQGCVNDANNWKLEFEKRSFNKIYQLLDSQATKSNIVDTLKSIMGQLKQGDLFVWCNSSHGSWIPDKNFDEPDGRDECLVPYDSIGDPNKLITDDELYVIFGIRPVGARVVMISDSCHSGSVSRTAPTFPGVRHKAKFISPDHFIDGADLFKAHKSINLPSAIKSDTCLLMAGCKDDEYSYDAHIAGIPCGAYTYSCLETLKQNPKTYRDWFRLIRNMLPNSAYNQSPQLSGSFIQKNWPVFE